MYDAQEAREFADNIVKEVDDLMESRKLDPMNPIGIEEIEKAVRLEQLDYVVPVDAVFEQYPKGVASEAFQKLLENGHPIPGKAIHFPDSVDFAPTIRMYDYHQRFVGLFSYVSETKAYKPIKMFLAKE